MSEESLAFWRDLDDSRMIAYSLVQLGEAVYHLGDLNCAESLFQEALALFRALDEKRGTAFTLSQIGNAALDRREFDQGSAHFAESLKLRMQVGEKWAIIESIEDIARVASESGRTAQAVNLFGATESLRLAIGAPLSTSRDEDREQLLSRARGSLGETFAHEWTRGQELSLEEAISKALSLYRAPAAVGITDGNTLSRL